MLADQATVGQPGDPPKANQGEAFVHSVAKLQTVPRRLIPTALALATVLCVGLLAAAPVLHEYFELDGAPPVAQQAPQPASASDEVPSGTDATAQADPPSSMPAAGAAPGPHASPDPSHYRLDSNTSRPDQVGYDDPFTPSIPPFKRLVAYDAVNRDLELVVADRTHNRVEIGGKPQPGDDQFFGDIELSDAELVRIPSVGPMTRILAARTIPASRFRIMADSADNWFVQSSGGGGRLLLHLSVDRDVFGSEFANVSWQALEPALPALPGQVARAAQPVLEHLELSRSMTPARAVERLVTYFRAFAPSDDERTAKGAELYEEIALGQVGVCRHRSFAFVVTALALGIPTRFVHNEAHAWVEVYDSQLWHRIDLGGAAGDVQFGELDVPHVAPPDPHQWPANSESGQEMVRQSSSGAGGSERGSTAVDQAPTVASDQPLSEPPAVATGSAAASGSSAPTEPPASDVEPTDALDAETEEPIQKEAAPAETTAQIQFSLETSEAVRGSRVALNGRVSEGDAACPLRKVRVMLRDATGRAHVLGVLVTDEAGRFTGEVVVSDSIPVGDHDLYITSPADASCGPADTR